MERKCQKGSAPAELFFVKNRRGEDVHRMRLALRDNRYGVRIITCYIKEERE